MRRLSDNFMHQLTRGFLAPLTRAVVRDNDLNLQIRDNYLNVYFKGNSLLKLTEAGDTRYSVEIHPKFTAGVAIADLDGPEATTRFVEQIPALKENIIEHGHSSLEVEYEQLIIRANNRERRTNSEYFIVDRQYAVGRMRFDLLGFYWRRAKRRRGQTVAPCLMEVKFALNADISRVHRQLARYYDALRANAARIADEAQSMFRQRLELGLYEQDPQRIEAMKTLTFARDVDRFRIILVLVDYNPHSSRLDLEKLARLPFADQIKVFFSGFAMWQQNLHDLPVG